MSYIIKLGLEVNNMAFYNLETKDKPRRAITYFEVYYGREDTDCKYVTLKYKFNIYFLDAFEVSKSYGELQDTFVKELQLLQATFYDGMYNAVNTNKIKFRIDPDDYKGIDDEKTKIYQWFLPKQREFADKWGLGINVD